MTDVLSSLAVPCARCGALLPVHPGSPSLGCGHCGAQSQLATQQIERLNQHMTATYAAYARARMYQEGAGSMRLLRQRGALYLAVFLGPGVVAALGCWAFVSLTDAHYVIEVIGERHDATAIIISGVLIISMAAGLLLIMVDTEAAKRRATGIARESVGVSRCVSCGATVPVILGWHAACPFCGAGLAVSEEAAHRLESAAHAQASTAYAEYTDELRRIGVPVITGPPERPAVTDEAPYGSQSGAASSWQAVAPALHPQAALHLDALARAIGFRPEDLQAHRMGRWSRRDRLKRTGIGCGVGAFLGIPMLVFVALSTTSVVQFVEIVAQMSPVPFLAFMVIALPAALGSVEAIAGLVNVSSAYEAEDMSTGGSTIVLQHYATIGGRSFKVNPATASTIVSGRAYRVYVSSWGKRLMSMEPVAATAGSSTERSWTPS